MGWKSICAACVAAAGASLVTPHAAKADDIECWVSQPNGQPVEWTPALETASVGEDEIEPPAGGTVMEAATPVPNGDLQKPPYKFIGQIFYQKDTAKFNASAEFIYGDVLITAAHNLLSQKGSASSMMFVRTSPSGDENKYQVTYGAYLKDWSTIFNNPPSAAKTSKDYAIVFTANSFADGGLRPYTGGTLPKDVEIKVVAYAGTGQKHMAEQVAKTAEPKEGAYGAVPGGFLKGASGGAWLTTNNEIFSVVSTGNDARTSGPVIDMAHLPDWIEAARIKCKPAH